MRKLTIALLLLFGAWFQAFSQTKVDEATAFNTAQAFAENQMALKGQTLNLVSADGIYIYDIGNQGFVIISGNTVLPPVLGWSEQGNFPALEDAPENFAAWIRHYSEMADFAVANGIAPETRILRQWEEAAHGIFGNRSATAVDPLLSTHWNQDCFYNEYCPSTSGDGGWGGPCGHVYAGCVACAMSQIMKYWNHPATGYGSHSYNHSQYGSQSADFAATTYHWEQMPNEVWEHNDAVATLMYHCGVSVNMNYSASGSGAYSDKVETAMRNYFGYCAAKYRTKSSYSDEAWDALLKAELDLAQPVYYSGSSESGGHAFVCDGYDNNGLFHFNFGWSGAGDGYYSTYDVNSFNQSQAVVTNLYPISIQADANGIIYVTPDGTGDGSSWGNATNRLELATAMSKDGHTKVWVKGGTYFGDTSDSASAFYITQSNRVYGSFKGDESPDYDLSLRNFNGNASVLDGQHQRRLLTLSDGLTTGTAAIWDGFIIQNGASGSGGGVFLNNYATLSNCIIKNNTSSIFGGGIYINASGGSSHVSLNNCVIRDNTASMGGGVCDRLGVNYTNCVISNNTASTKGGGIYNYTNSNPTLKNCVISNNTAKIAGAFYVRGNCTAYNCDFVMNLATEDIGGIFNEKRHNKFHNCILWGNIADNAPSQTEGEADYEYCAVQGAVDGLHNIDLPAENNGEEPGWYVRFNHPAQGAGAAYYNNSWSLHPRSICLNAGKPNTAGLGPTDVAGNARIQKGRIDIGAYESCTSLTLIEDSVYENNDYWFHNRLLTESGYYTALLDGQDCDSVVGLTLMIQVGITEGSENAIQVWPNPTTGILHIAAEDINKVEVRNLLGQLVWQAEKIESIDLCHLEKGVYFLMVGDGNGKKSVTKIIKE